MVKLRLYRGDPLELHVERCFYFVEELLMPIEPLNNRHHDRPDQWLDGLWNGG